MKKAGVRKKSVQRRKPKTALHHQHRSVNRPHAQKPRSFVMASFGIERRAKIKSKQKLYAETKKIARAVMGIKHGKAGLPEVIEALGLGKKGPTALFWTLPSCLR